MLNPTRYVAYGIYVLGLPFLFTFGLFVYISIFLVENHKAALQAVTDVINAVAAAVRGEVQFIDEED